MSTKKISTYALHYMYAVCVQGKFCHVFSSPLYNTVVRLLCWSESSELTPLNVCLLTLCACRNLLVLIPQQCHIYNVKSMKKRKSISFNLLITLLLAVNLNAICFIFISSYCFDTNYQFCVSYLWVCCFHKNHLYMYCILNVHEFNVCTFDFHFDGASTATFGTLSFYFKCLSLDSHSTCKGFSHMEALFYPSCYKTLLHRFQTVNFQIHVP